MLLKVDVPKFRLLMTPQKSPPPAEILLRGVLQVAVGIPVAVGVGPGARHVGRNAGGGVPERVVRRRDRRFDELAEGRLERSLAVAEQVVGDRGSRGDVLVAVDDRCLREVECRLPEPALEVLLRRPARRTVEAQPALDGQPAARPLFLHEQRVVAHPQVVLLVVDVLGQLVRHAVVGAIAQIVRAAVGRAEVAQLVADVAELQGAGAGDIRRREAPRRGDVLVPAVAEQVGRLRAVHQARDVAVGGASRRALLDDAHGSPV